MQAGTGRATKARAFAVGKGEQDQGSRPWGSLRRLTALTGLAVMILGTFKQNFGAFKQVENKLPRD